MKKDSLARIQTFVNFLKNVWYDAAAFIIPQSVVLDLMQHEEELQSHEGMSTWHDDLTTGILYMLITI